MWTDALGKVFSVCHLCARLMKLGSFSATITFSGSSAALNCWLGAEAPVFANERKEWPRERGADNKASGRLKRARRAVYLWVGGFERPGEGTESGRLRAVATASKTKDPLFVAVQSKSLWLRGSALRLTLARRTQRRFLRVQPVIYSPRSALNAEPLGRNSLFSLFLSLSLLKPIACRPSLSVAPPPHHMLAVNSFVADNWQTRRRRTRIESAILARRSAGQTATGECLHNDEWPPKRARERIMQIVTYAAGRSEKVWPQS